MKFKFESHTIELVIQNPKLVTSKWTSRYLIKTNSTPQQNLNKPTKQIQQLGAD